MMIAFSVVMIALPLAIIFDNEAVTEASEPASFIVEAKQYLGNYGTMSRVKDPSNGVTCYTYSGGSSGFSIDCLENK